MTRPIAAEASADDSAARRAALDPPPPPRRAGRRQGARPGNSLLAQGEPMIWLTGGALVLALFMIFGLLTLVLVSGGSTFWVASVERVQLADGTEVAGELARSETFTLTKPTAARASGVAAENARRLLADGAEPTVRRRLYRVGNFELTQQHYVWVADYELADPDAVAVVEPWMIALERIEWGRFFGTLDSYRRLHHRPIDQVEDDLRRIAELLETHAGRLGETEQADVAERLSAVRKSLDAHRRESAEKFLRETCGPPPSATPENAAEQPRWELVLDDQSTAPYDASAPFERVVGARRIETDAEVAWEAFQREASGVRQRADRIVRVTKHDVGRLGDDIEEARLAMRAAELRSGVAFVDRAVEGANLAEELAAGEAEIERVAQTAELAGRHPEAGATVSAAARTIAAQLRDEFVQQTAESRERIKTIDDELSRESDDLREAVARYREIRREAAALNAEAQREVAELERENAGCELVLRPTGGEPTPIQVASIVRAYRPNGLDWLGKLGVYLSRWWEFLTDVPREANSEGGVFPAIFGTVAMTLVMSLAVVPFGVLAALYLREYARGGLIVSVLRIAINNLAGVPSIVFGVFGLGFFCYLVGAFLDGGPKNAGFEPATPYAWYLGLFGLAMIGTLAFVAGVTSARYQHSAGSWARWLGRLATGLWILSTLALAVLIFMTPYFDGLFASRLPNPTLGKGGLMWSSLTLALLTLPVVIVATEEALSAVPNSMREGSYACGAGKWQTIRRIVLPQALPGIMTGMILAMARGAGEVAPLMLVGAVKVAPELPVDASFPFVHPERSYLHLGFHIFDLGFQSQNSEAAKPMVFTTTLLLIALIAGLNIFAVWLRGRLRKKFRSVQF